MSKARLVITAVVTEGRSRGEVARAYGLSQGWVSRLVARYRAEGEAAFEPRSRRRAPFGLPAVTNPPRSRPPKDTPGLTGINVVRPRAGALRALHVDLARGTGVDWHLSGQPARLPGP